MKVYIKEWGCLMHSENNVKFLTNIDVDEMIDKLISNGRKIHKYRNDLSITTKDICNVLIKFKDRNCVCMKDSYRIPDTYTNITYNARLKYGRLWLHFCIAEGDYISNVKIAFFRDRSDLEYILYLKRFDQI